MSDLRFYQLSRDPFTKEIAASEAYETADLREARGRLDLKWQVSLDRIIGIHRETI